MPRHTAIMSVILFVAGASVGCGPGQVSLDVFLGGSGSGKVTSGANEINCPSTCSNKTLPQGTALTLTAIPDAGSVLADWRGACAGSGSAPTCQVNLAQATRVFAYFRRSTKTVAVGAYHTCVLRPAGDVVCWGRNSDGQVGAGLTSAYLPVTAVRGIRKAVSIAAGGYHTCALLEDGTVQCWGNNKEGALGDGTNTNANAPTSFVSGITDAVAITAGGYHSCVLRAGGTVSCWGRNANGQLGDTTTTDANKPVTVSLGAAGPASAVSAGGFHTCAIMQSNSSVICWGMNNDGQLGIGSSSLTVAISRAPVKKMLKDGTLSDFAARSIAASIGVGQLGGAVLGGFHSCAIGIDNIVYCWGNNNDTQVYLTAGILQTKTVLAATADLRITTETEPAMMIAAGAYHTCRLFIEGVDCRGLKADGQLGGNETLVPGTAGAFYLAAGGFHTCAVLNSGPMGTVACWGNNGDGQVNGVPGASVFTPVSLTTP